MARHPKNTAIRPDEFLSLVTHEMKNPLTSIAGFTNFAEDAVRNNDPESALESLEVVRGEAMRILRLAEDLLDASAVSAAQFSVRLSDDVDLCELVQQVARRYEASSGRTIDVQLETDCPLVVGDSQRLTQVIENLISNAVKYSPADSPIRVVLSADERRVRLSIANDGPVIPKKQLSRLFQRFSRLEVHGGDGEVKGTGLGLYISREIVARHGGTISVRSVVGEGTIFTMELPRSELVN